MSVATRFSKTLLTSSILFAAFVAPACGGGSSSSPSGSGTAKATGGTSSKATPNTKTSAAASTAPAASSAPAAGSASAPAGSGSASAAPSGSPAPGGEGDIGAAKYPVCDGQGGDATQLAPAFLEKMKSCDKGDTAPADELAKMAGDGKIIEGKGDCQYDKGISCHFHTSMEFVKSDHLKDDAVGEMHCIVPSPNADSPTVYGAHLKCKAGTAPAADASAHAGQEDKGPKACSSALIGVLAQANCHSGWKCCDNGTLTKPVSKQDDGQKKLRPDFRICEDDAVEIDCGLLHGMHGHTANVHGVGETYDGKFLKGEHDEPADH